MATVTLTRAAAIQSGISKRLQILTILVAFTPAVFAADKPAQNDARRSATAETTGTAILWRQPTDIASRDLFNGPGGQAHAPKSTIFTFVKEDLDGTATKFVVRDDEGVKWKVKLGAEAKPETAASRIVWAAGYSANEDYFLPNLHIKELPSHLHRGQNQIGPGGSVQNARLKREPDDEKKEGVWRWKHDPFVGTREYNGLRVLMALINNWDLKDVNNAVYKNRGDKEQVYAVSDVGATFGTTGVVLNLKNARGNLKAYEHSRFITKTTPKKVNFATPGRPTFWMAFNPPRYFMRLSLRSIGHNVPREDAKWMGDLLGGLSAHQIRDAFRAAGYSPEEVEGFARTVEGRISALRAL
jgi:hypothetical protein